MHVGMKKTINGSTAAIYLGARNQQKSWKILEVPPFTICTYLYTASKPRNFNGFALPFEISLGNPLVFVVVVVVVVIPRLLQVMSPSWL